MASAKNRVIAGEYEGERVAISGSSGLDVGGLTHTVESYELITDDSVKSAASGVARGIIGGALLGPVGMIVGATSAKKKGIYTVAVEFGSGARSLIEVDDKIYKHIVKSSF